MELCGREKIPVREELVPLEALFEAKEVGSLHAQGVDQEHVLHEARLLPVASLQDKGLARRHDDAVDDGTALPRHALGGGPHGQLDPDLGAGGRRLDRVGDVTAAQGEQTGRGGDPKSLIQPHQSTSMTRVVGWLKAYR